MVAKHTSAVPELGRLRQEDYHKFKASSGNPVTLYLTSSTGHREVRGQEFKVRLSYSGFDQG